MAGTRNDALRGRILASLLNSSSTEFQAILEPSMSILLADALSISPVQAADPAIPLHQSSSGLSPPVRRNGWWSWLDRQHERKALREIADDPHLLKDLGLTREQALREAAKPFWLWFLL
ncbi:hypothetical protein HU230_0017545 [Bradyrhizobium quebecense]|uniref:DUF1127 domain-containing protein n=1 Tax=Bradyrhizobium quebecense TaxID=2748629 RepID=A0A973WL41_9BRAD|nr:hypothetical protein [Bradyrhizobium quebecense]UGA47736.1 hypothetical protein HU230_0017545 [Bradyrhizobium quebecense]